jgi:hypothetical protein
MIREKKGEKVSSNVSLGRLRKPNPLDIALSKSDSFKKGKYEKKNLDATERPKVA